jgi:hypothetical protein
MQRRCHFAAQMYCPYVVSFVSRRANHHTYEARTFLQSHHRLQHRQRFPRSKIADEFTRWKFHDSAQVDRLPNGGVAGRIIHRKGTAKQMCLHEVRAVPCVPKLTVCEFLKQRVEALDLVEGFDVSAGFVDLLLLRLEERSFLIGPWTDFER